MDMRNESAKTRLVRLSDSNLVLTNPDEDIRKRTVQDLMGEEIGVVNDIFIDEDEQKVRLIEVNGGILGLGESQYLIPVDAISSIAKDHIRINRSQTDVSSSPKYDPQLIEEDYLNTIYTHYGLMPFWGAGYMYPPFPFYPRP